MALIQARSQGLPHSEQDSSADPNLTHIAALFVTLHTTISSVLNVDEKSFGALDIGLPWRHCGALTGYRYELLLTAHPVAGSRMTPRGSWIKMDDSIAHTRSSDGILKNAARIGETSTSQPHAAFGSSPATATGPAATTAEDAEAAGQARASRGRWMTRSKRKSYSHAHFKVYKRRWFGLAQLVLLNIVASWDVRLSPPLFLTKVYQASMQNMADVHQPHIVADFCTRLNILSAVL